MLTDTQRAAAAAALRTAELDRVPISPLTAAYDRLTVDDAYEIQLINIRQRIAGGAIVRGHKVGLSSKAMQEMMGVAEPDYGHLLAEMFIFEHDSVPVSRYLQPRIEVETAFVLDRALPAPGCTAADVLRCTAFICPAIELIDSRSADWMYNQAGRHHRRQRLFCRSHIGWKRDANPRDRSEVHRRASVDQR
jgi:2-keto-4-pentenoate hydratase